MRVAGYFQRLGALEYAQTIARSFKHHWCSPTLLRQAGAAGILPAPSFDFDALVQEAIAISSTSQFGHSASLLFESTSMLPYSCACTTNFSF